MLITAGNYIERSDGAVWVRLFDQNTKLARTLFFWSSGPIAIKEGDTMFAIDMLIDTNGYKRIRAAVLRHGAKKIVRVSGPELRHLVEAALVWAATNAIDDVLLKKEK